MNKERSIGVTIFAWLFIIAGALGLFGFVFGLLFGQGCASAGAQEFGQSFQGGGGVCPIVPKTFMSRLGYYWSKLISPLFALIGGIFLLRLEEWARKLILALCCVSIAITVAGLGTYIKQRDTFKVMMEQGMQEAMEKEKQEIMEKYKLEHQEKALAEYDEKVKIMQKVAPVKMMSFMFYLIMISFILWNLGVIFFFTRQRVKEQFSSQQIIENPA